MTRPWTCSDSSPAMEEELIKLISARGPLTGSELKEALSENSLLLWQTCNHSRKLVLRRFGRRYLRLDRRVDGFARLSPSVLREFLTYSLIGLSEDPDSIEKRAQEIVSHIEDVSRRKHELAYRAVCDVRRTLEEEWPKDGQVCCIIAGDIVYTMAHDVPRPEKSTGRLVNGSDIDLIFVVEDSLPEDFVRKLDHSVYQEKYRILTTPAFREEIDYIVKSMSRVREQLRFDTFRHMVACKILQEGTFLYGSEDLFRTIKMLLHEYGVVERLDDFEQKAQTFRQNAEEYLLRADVKKMKKDDLYLFYPTEESEEFE